MVTYKKFITREYIKENRDKIFLFGDNILEMGYGGQAKEMRGEPNSIGISTKKAPHMFESAFFTDTEYEINCKILDKEFEKIPKDKEIVIPEDGLGTGLSQLPTRAPKTYQYLLKKIKELEND